MQMTFQAGVTNQKAGQKRVPGQTGTAATGLFPAQLPAINVDLFLLFFFMLCDINRVNLETTDYFFI